VGGGTNMSKGILYSSIRKVHSAYVFYFISCKNFLYDHSFEKLGKFHVRFI
jgi:hypothetical protein